MKTIKYTETVKTTIKYIKGYLTQEDYGQLGRHCLSCSANLELSKARGFTDGPVCPEDETHSVIKYGKRNENQKYYCKTCKKVFSERSNTMLQNSKFDTFLWINFITGILNGNATLGELASSCDISIPTAFYAKLRIVYAMECLNEKIVLSGDIHADETSIPFNAKGQSFEEIDRKPRKRGNGNTQKNRNQNSICIVVAVEHDYVEDRIRIASKVAGFGQASKKRIFQALAHKIAPSEDTVLITDGSRVYSLLAEKLGLPWERIVTEVKGKKRVPGSHGQYNIQLVNAYHSKLRLFLRKLRGVSSKYLLAHLQIFDFCINYAHLDHNEQALLILKTLLETPHPLTNDQLVKRYYMPSYRTQIAENWKSYFPKEDVRIYHAVKNGLLKKDIIEKYHTSYKRIRTLVKKIDSLRAEVEAAAEAAKQEKPLKEISDKNWEIYTLYKTGQFTYKELGKQFSLSLQRIAAIVKYIDARPEGYEGTKRALQTKTRKMQQHQRAIMEKKNTLKRYENIYRDFTALCAGRSQITLKQAYQILGAKYNRSKNTIRNVVFQYRKNDPAAVWRKKGSKVQPDFRINPNDWRTINRVFNI